MYSVLLKTLVVGLMMLWLCHQHNMSSTDNVSSQSYPEVTQDLARLSFIEPYAPDELQKLKKDLQVFFARYGDTFRFNPKVSKDAIRVGPLPLLYKLKSRVQQRFMKMQYAAPHDIPWSLVLRNMALRTAHMLQAYIEDVRERLQLSRYSPELIQGYYNSRLYGNLSNDDVLETSKK